MSSRATDPALLDDDYQRLLAFRSELRRFLRWSEHAANNAGLTPSLHQLLLVLRGHPAVPGPTIGQAADELQMRHHSAVELVRRAEAKTLIHRERDPVDHRRVHLQLTARGRQQLEVLTREHLTRIPTLAETLERVMHPRAVANAPERDPQRQWGRQEDRD
jgi:DNA-binding MarR family transcriptional regulator